MCPNKLASAIWGTCKAPNQKKNVGEVVKGLLPELFVAENELANSRKPIEACQQDNDGMIAQW